MIAAGLLIIYLLPYATKIIPSPVVCIVVLTAFAVWSDLPFKTVGDMGRLPAGLPVPLLPTLPSPDMLAAVFPYALGIAIVGLIESLLTSAVVDDLTATTAARGKAAARVRRGRGERSGVNLREVGRNGISCILQYAILLCITKHKELYL